MKTLILTFLVVFNTETATAKDLFVQGRLFLANTRVKLENLNNVLESEGLKKIDKTVNLGVEITFPVSRFFEPGMRYTHRQFNADPISTGFSDYKARGKQESVLFLARFPFIRSSFFRFDVFAGVGGSNTTFTIKTASSDGELNRTAAKDWLATPYLATGASVGIGLKNVLLFAEGGYEANKVDKLKKTGTVNSGLSSINLSGNYFMLGILFDGIKGYKK